MNDTTATAASPNSVAAAAADPRPAFAAASATTQELFDALRPEQLDLPTPCALFDVRALAGHLLTVVDRVTALGAGTDPLALPPVTTGIADDAWAEAFRSRAAAVAPAWADPATLQREMVLPWATAPGAGMLATYVAELTVHTWDLATALGVAADFDDAAVALGLVAARRALPGGDREAAFAAIVAGLPAAARPAERPFGDPVPAAATAAPIDQLVAWYGRRP